jgi:cyclophilin family peptidyl-prolyl cis-trans isomerase
VPSRSRQRQLAKLAQRRQQERRRQRRQRILAAVVAAVVAIGGGAFAAVALLGGGGSANPSSSETPTPSASSSYAAGTGEQTGTVTVQTPPASQVACGAKVPPDANKPKPQFNGPPPMAIDQSATYVATMQTSCGTIEISLLADRAPITVNSFVFLAQHHYFDGTFFHRIAESIDVIQGGDPTGSGSGGPGYSFQDELNPPLSYGPGTLAMANSGPNTNGSQFFVITGPDGHGLDSNPNYTIFGQITKGLDVAQKIQAVGVKGSKPGDPTADGPPAEAIYIESVTIAQT